MFLQVRPIKTAQISSGERGGSGDNHERDGDIDHHLTVPHNGIQRSDGPHGVQHDDNHGNGTRDGGYQDAPALLQQLKDIQLSDKDTLNRLLSNSHPPALDELDKAKGSLVHLATARDGRVFSVLVGSTVESNWELEYPIRGFRTPTQTRRMDDHMLRNESITLYQVDKLKDILDLVKHSDAGHWFRASIQVLWPELWDQYRRLVERPVDLSLLEKNLEENNYQTIAIFMRDVELLRLNTVIFFGTSHMMTTVAKRTVDMITYKMGQCSLEDDTTKKRATARTTKKVQPAKTVFSRGQIREMIYKLYVPSGQGASGLSRYPRFVIPLGRVCVARSPNTETYATKRIVVMDIASPRKALWLVGDHFTVSADTGPYRWLPDDQLNLLDTNRRKGPVLSKLTDDISLWDVGSNHVGGDGLSEKGLLDRDAMHVPDGVLQRNICPSEVLLDLTSKRRVLEAIQHGGGDGEQSTPRKHSRDEQGSQADEPAAKRLKSNETRGAT